MRIYVSHSTGFDYKTELYEPLKKNTQDFQFYLPHEQCDTATDTRSIIENSDCILAEVSYPSTGQGFELAWAYDANVPIICVHKPEAKISSALRLFCKEFYCYNNAEEILKILSDAMDRIFTKLC